MEGKIHWLLVDYDISRICVRKRPNCGDCWSRDPQPSQVHPGSPSTNFHPSRTFLRPVYLCHIFAGPRKRSAVNLRRKRHSESLRYCLLSSGHQGEPHLYLMIVSLTWIIGYSISVQCGGKCLSLSQWKEEANEVLKDSNLCCELG